MSVVVVLDSKSLRRLVYRSQNPSFKFSNREKKEEKKEFLISCKYRITSSR